MRLLLWNVNGLRAISKKKIKEELAFDQFIKPFDIIVLNETKINETQLRNLDIIPNTFTTYSSHSTVKKGYSGVSILTKHLPIRRIDPPFNDNEGRVVILEYKRFILIGVYVPNAGTKNKTTGLPKRHQYRTTKWDIQFRNMCVKLEKKKPIIILGDMNVAFQDQDVYAPMRFTNHAGFTEAERDNFGHLLQETSVIDVWRRKHPTKIQYSFFDYRSRARARNAGWRIDYALVSKSLYSNIDTCTILSNIYGSDHLPVQMNITI